MPHFIRQSCTLKKLAKNKKGMKRFKIINYQGDQAGIRKMKCFIFNIENIDHETGKTKFPPFPPPPSPSTCGKFLIREECCGIIQQVIN
jgi:hypothetical protein